MNARVLNILAEHPLVSAEQLGVLLASHPNVVRKELKQLQAKDLVIRINPRSPAISCRTLFYISKPGSAQTERVRSYGKYGQRLAHLWFVIERVFAVRNLFLQMGQPFHIKVWDVEAKTSFLFRNRTRSLILHGVGYIPLSYGPTPFVVEWDTGILEYEQARMARLLEWHHSLRSSAPPNKSISFVLLIVARDIHRLQVYYATLRAASLSRNLPVPPAYLATTRDVWRYSITAPIWYSFEGKREQALFANLPFTANTHLTPRLLNIRPQITTTKNVIDLKRVVFDASAPVSRTSLLAIKRDLSPQTKRVLDIVAAHPLLTAREIAMLLDDFSGQVPHGLKQLTGFGLLHALQMHGETRYLLSQIGIQYLAAANGFGRAVKAYGKARGWKHSLSQLVRHWEHT